MNSTLSIEDRVLNSLKHLLIEQFDNFSNGLITKEVYVGCLRTIIFSMAGQEVTFGTGNILGLKPEELGKLREKYRQILINNQYINENDIPTFLNGTYS